MLETSRRNDAPNACSSGADEKPQLIIGRQYFKSVLPLIKNARISIDILMFHWAWYERDLTCEISLLNAAIVGASKRGVKVRCYVSMPASFKKLKSLGLNTRLYSGSGVMHAKVLIFDSRIAVFGSHNFSQRAMLFNKEVSMILYEKSAVLQLERYFETLWRNNK